MTFTNAGLEDTVTQVPETPEGRTNVTSTANEEFSHHAWEVAIAAGQPYPDNWTDCPLCQRKGYYSCDEMGGLPPELARKLNNEIDSYHDLPFGFTRRLENPADPRRARRSMEWWIGCVRVAHKLMVQWDHEDATIDGAERVFLVPPPLESVF
jgi:hypothetical protein